MASAAKSEAPLFTIPIPPSKPGQEGGSITCTVPAPQVYVLTWRAPPDNRLTSGFVAALGQALDTVEFGDGGKRAPGVLVTASALPKFYSNGLDLQTALDTPGFFEQELYPLWRRLLTYPMPTIALISGHCFAGGLMLAMHHDYRVFAGSPGGRGFLCLNELDFGMPLMPPMSAIFRLKASSPATYRRLVLEAHRFGGPEALEAGLVDLLGREDESGLEAVLRLVKERGLTTKAKTGVYGLLKTEMYRESLALLDAKDGGQAGLAKLQAAEAKRKEGGRARVEAWEKHEAQGGKSKL